MKARLFGFALAAFCLPALIAFANQPFIPGGVDSVGLTNIVPDTVVYTTDTANHDNWEPYASVLGNSVFLIEVNTFAEGSTDNQRFALVFQPVAGGAHALGEVFYADDGSPFRGQINASRQDGNPGRVAGDKRPGAVNFITGAEASPDAYAPFQSSPDRWSLGFDRGTDARYATVQTFKLDQATLAQTALSKAFDAADGRLTSGTSDSQQNTRFGGDLAALDNGNFVVAVEDRTKTRNPDGNAAVALIVKADGTIVKDSFVVANGDLWSNLAACKGGFAVRVAGVIYFFDNDGVLKGQVDQDTATGTSFSRDRGDDTRIAGHINSPYIYLAGVNGADNVVRLAAFDSRNQSFVAVADVNEPELTATFGRVHPAVDALDRVVVAFDAKLENYEQNQVLARVLALDATANSIKPLTKSFFPFLNHGATGFATADGGIAVTTRQILIAAKGTVNSTNNVAAGPDTLPQTTVYTVINHPNPADDPTPPVGGQAAGNPLDFGQTVNGFQDDFNGATRDPSWVAVGPGGDIYRQSDGVLHVNVHTNDPNHLLYMPASGYSNAVQEVLARIRVTAFGTGDASRAGIGVGVQTNSTDLSRGLNLHFRDSTQDGVAGRQFKLLDDARAWGPAGLKTNIGGQLTPGWTNNVWYWLRLRLDPKADATNSLFGKVWLADGVTPEPATWQMTWKDSAIPKPLRQGFAGITGSSITGLGNFEVDYILIKAAGLPQIKVAFAPVGPPPTPPAITDILHLGGTIHQIIWYGNTLLEQSTNVAGPWAATTGLPMAGTINTAAGAAQFYRLKP